MDEKNEKILGMPIGRGLDYVNEIHLLPGKHTARLTYRHHHFYDRHFDLWFVAEPGKTYIGKYYLFNNAVRVWIEEEKTEEKVGGIVGSIDEPEA
ncbi:MAG: hypothetical protein AAGB12_06000 [Pseudomonadota bacterium]